MRAVFAIGAAAAFALGAERVVAEDKTAGEKSAEIWDRTKQKTKDVSKAVAEKTKETVEAIEHKIDRPDAEARKVDVKVTDKGVQMPKSLPPGKTAFAVTNTGKQKHNFKIAGNGLDESFWFSIAPGSSKTMQAELKAGSYEAVCSVGAHAGKETKTQLTVR